MWNITLLFFLMSTPLIVLASETEEYKCNKAIVFQDCFDFYTKYGVEGFGCRGIYPKPAPEADEKTTLYMSTAENTLYSRDGGKTWHELKYSKWQKSCDDYLWYMQEDLRNGKEGYARISAEVSTAFCTRAILEELMTREK